jgi:hypothetical protein
MFRSIFKFGGLGGIAIGLLQIIFYSVMGGPGTEILLYVGIAVMSTGIITFIITMIVTFSQHNKSKSVSSVPNSIKTNDTIEKTRILKLLKDLKSSYDSKIISQSEYDKIRERYMRKLNENQSEDE